MALSQSFEGDWLNDPDPIADRSVPRGAWRTLQVLSRLRTTDLWVSKRRVQGSGYVLIELGLRAFALSGLWPSLLF